MSVSHILSTKGHEVVSIPLDHTLGEAVRMLAEQRIGAVLVSDGEHPVSGIISERDIVRAISDHGAASLDQPVSRFMTAKVVTCTSGSSINDLMEAMTNGKFRHVPVVEGGKLTGIISIGDVVKHRLQEMENEQNALRDYIATA